jgi:acetylornithine deacetylase/succinyl-diaminopimelate desuccinylase-like protein
MSDLQKVLPIIGEFVQECTQTFLQFAAMKNLSPKYNKNWEKDGELLTCLNSMKDYISSQNISSIKNLQIFQENGVTPSLFFSVSPSSSTETYTILLYSHIDKIPFGDGWTKCDPNNPKVIDSYLYGRGVTTSLYAIFTILGMLKAIEELSLPRPNMAVLIESSFESGSYDLLTNLDKALKIVPTINQVVCLDTWGPTNNHFHYMKSTRGIINFDVKITTGIKSVHSGSFGGLIPDPMMIFNNILSNKIEKIEKSEDGKATNIKIPPLEVDITENQKKECQEICLNCGFELMAMMSYEGISQLIGSKNEDEDEDFLTAYINGVLRPSYSILGFEDMPSIENASGSLKPYLHARLCFRTPPNVDINTAYENLKKLFLENPPFGAKIEILNEDFNSGIDLEESNNNITEKMISTFNVYCQERYDRDIQALRMSRDLPCLNYLTAKFKNVPIFVTGAGNTFTGNARDGNECIQLIRLINFSAIFTCYISNYKNYKE